MHLLTLNTGSSSVRLAAFVGVHGSAVAPRASARHALGHEAPPRLLRRFLDECRLDGVDAVAHRVVHGGQHLTRACLIDADVEAEIGRLAPLAPLHNPVALDWIRVCRDLFGDSVPQVAVFDTAFFASLPPVARHYALPRALTDQYGLRRYGFHGLAHQGMWRRWCVLRPDLTQGGRVISFQLGAGCSAAAVLHGAPCDTSMGFSPLEGLVMATRSGDVDAGLLTYVQEHAALSPPASAAMLNRESGLRGIAGESDMQKLLARDDAEAQLAIELYCYRARKYLGAYLAVLGGVDGILFGGGVGENAPEIRARILDGMQWAGIALDEDANRHAGTEAPIARPTSKADIRVIAVDEAAILAQEALALLRGKNGQD